MKTKIFLLLLLSLYIVNCTLYITLATVRYVSPTGSSTPPYTSWETAADSIMECINISVFGDTIYVANGTYIEKVTMIHGLTMIGAGIDSCIIDTRTISQFSDFNAITMKDECIVEGFHIIVRSSIGGNTGILSIPGPEDSLDFQGKIMNNKISMAGYGISSDNSFLTIKNNIIEDVSYGIDVFGLDTSVLDTIYNNYLFQIKTSGISTALAGRGIIFNNLIEMTSTINQGISTGSSGTSQVYNNFVLDSYVGISVGAVPDQAVCNIVSNNLGYGIWFSEQSIVNNNIVLGVQNGYYLSDGIQNIYFNNAWNCDYGYYNFTPDSTNLEVDPMLVNEDSLDFHLQKYSPMIDAGDPLIFDKDGTRSDIGFYGGPYGESYSYLDLAPRVPVNLNATLDSLTVGITWNKNTEADFNHYNVYRDTTKNFIIDSTNLFVSTDRNNLIDFLPDYLEKIYYKLTAIDNQGNESEPSEEVGFILTSITDNKQTISDYRLYQNYPNPFNPSTKISYRLKERGYVKLYVYDIKGELVSVLVNQTQEAGYYEVDFNVKGQTSNVQSDLASGIYIYQIMVRNEKDIPVFTDMKKMLLIK
ncbi:MAG: T9SS type A sorting domain-containing protein [Ignavibacteriales bacterium]|nr:T9SS type A sorting domain-containing protein [Ignavibacteriales bacterium]